MSKGPDEVDLWGIAWARQRRMMLGITPLEPKDRLGKLTSTLGLIQKERVGAGEHTVKVDSSGKRDLNWPEVYTGVALTVHRAYQLMPRKFKLTMHLHYVWREVSVPEKAPTIGVSVSQYWSDVSAMKAFLHGAVIIGRDQQNTSRGLMSLAL